MLLYKNLSLIIIFCFACLFKSNTPVVTLIVKGSPKQVVRLQKVNEQGEYELTDSAFVEGNMTVKLRGGMQEGETPYLMRFSKSGTKYNRLILLDRETPTITIDYTNNKKTEIKGSVFTEELVAYTDKFTELSSEYNRRKEELLLSDFEKSSPNYISLKSNADVVLEELHKYVASTAMGTKSMVIAQNAMMCTELAIGQPLSTEQLALLKDRFGNRKLFLDYLVSYRNKKEIYAMPVAFVGKKLNDFARNNQNGAQISSKSLRGKVVLIDFWASWCRPCREESPYLVKARKDYAPKGFEILAVSIDEDTEKWKKAIMKDGTADFVHVIDTLAWKSDLVKQYDIKGIPFNLLVNKEGTIVAQNLRGEELLEKLKELIR
ncbi:TlpA family protein disulfide reductase [Rufibacter quisquiliarum]|uniref:Thiol-disulfide isomerase/thioredoxin n=1 Tax=Rufibacter quisquiliarum TaxID=1549639 RepID=A0A839GT59_9BACT|nr:TlpA disulfide reductase family protein [Rufibacter quisquiliarum]MBA9077598.1 thiol-disulfide isomerase/thioredoxin [Rufibacter quisquiliarum]